MSLLDTASLIVTPNAYKEGKLYSVIPSDGSGDLSVTRATTATRVNSAGLVEIVPYNLLTYSEQLDNSNWVKGDATISANSAIAPNGTNTADKFIANSNNAAHLFYQSVPTGSCSFSIYAKAAEETVFSMWLNDFSKNARFDLSTGTVVFSNVTSANITDVGNGWFRCEVYDTTSTSFVAIFGRNAAAYIGNGVDGMFFWGAQAVEGSTAKDYQKTETRLNIPRLDYSNGSCPSLLVEPQRTNLVTYSEQFDNNTAWAKINSSITANSAISPSGIQNADTITSTAPLPHIVSSVVSFGSTTNVSIFVKYISQRWVQLMSGGAFNGFANFDIQNGVIGTIGSNASDAKIEDFGNGWYRISVNLLGYTGITNLYFGFVASGTAAWNTFDPNFNKSIYAYGAQVEAGAYATSYIPTTSASVTRNDDFISKTSATSLIGQTEGTIFVDFYNDGNTIYNPFSISDGYYGDAIYFEQFLGQMYGVIWDSGSQQFSFNAGALSIGNHRMAIAYKTNDIAFYIDGVLKATDSSATIPTCSRIDVGYLASATVYKTFINAAALWQTRLTNAQLAQLTTI